MKIKPFFISSLVFPLLLINISTAHAWFDKTHLAIAKAAGYARWYSAAGADQASVKAGDMERRNHYFNNDNDSEVNKQLVLSQAARYNDPEDKAGHLYGAIVQALRDNDRFDRPFYQMAYAAHYIGDLSQPMHNYQPENDPVFRQRHRHNDGIVDHEILNNISEIEKHMYFIGLRSSPTDFEQDLATEVARIANLSRVLSKTLQRDNRNMTPEEAYRQLGHSASLLRAVLNRYGF